MFGIFHSSELFEMLNHCLKYPIRENLQDFLLRGRLEIFTLLDVTIFCFGHGGIIDWFYLKQNMSL